MTDQSLADRLFEASIAFAKVEGELYDVLHDIIDGWAVRDPFYGELEIGHDYYDGSVSISGLPKDFVPTEAQLGQLRELGFKACWLGRNKFISLMPAVAMP